MTAWNISLRLDGEEQVFQTVAIDDEHHVLTIGSSPLADVTLAGLDIADVHCTLIVNDVGFSWIRPEAMNLVTRVNDDPITDTARFQAGDRLEVGQHAIVLVDRPVPSTMTWKLAFHVRVRGSLPMEELQVFHRDNVVVGRSAGADLVLRAGNVSKRHCVFYVDRNGVLRIKDLGSTNGIWVNGRKITAPLPFGLGDKLYVGDWVVTLAELPKQVPG